MDLRPLLRPRHLLLTLLVGLLAGGTIAAAGAAPDPDVPTALSSPVAFPARSVGDHGVYEVWGHERIDGGADPESWGRPDQVIEFTWLPDELHLDDAGQLVWTNVLHLQVTRDDQEPRVQNATLLLRAGTAIPLGTQRSGPMAFGEPGSSALVTESWTQEGDSRDLQFGRSWHSSDPCLVLPTQGRVLALDREPIDGFKDCWWATSGFGAAVMRVQAVGGEPGQRDVLLRAAVPSLLGSQAVGRTWLREGLPYAVRYDRVSGDDESYAVALLTRFDGGSLPMRGASDPVDSVPLLEWAPRQAWGPSEAGITHPFPLSQAFAATRDHATYDGLRVFLRDHPDAYVCWAQYAAYEDSTRSQQRWIFGVTDGQQVLGVDTMRTAAKGPAINDPLAVVPGQGSVNITVEPTQQAPYGDFVPLPPELAPAKLPTVASMLRTWASYAAVEGTLPGLQANDWGFRVGADPDGEGGAVPVWFHAGHIDHTSTSQVPTELGSLGPTSSGWTRSSLSFIQDRPWSFSESRTTQSRDPVGVPEAATPAIPQDVEPTDQQATAVQSRDVRFEWTPRQRAAIGFGALLAGLLWWVSPLAKNAAVGLFSRIRDDDLLENPSRRLLRDLVEQSPGIHHQELVRRLGKGKGAAEHHLHKLVDGGLLIGRVAGGYKCYWVPGQATKTAVAAAPTLKSPVAQGIVRLRTQTPAISNAELARALGVRPATISYHVDRLRAAGVLTATGHAMPGLVVTEESAAAA